MEGHIKRQKKRSEALLLRGSGHEKKDKGGGIGGLALDWSEGVSR
jgi:hypothetical protein